MKIVFIAGVHGVGKTTAAQVISKRLEVLHLSASDVIKRQKNSVVNDKSKLVENIDQNQRRLIDGLKDFSNNELILLDGHFTMRRKLDGEIEGVSVDVFRQMNVCAIVLYVDSPADISDRLFLRDELRQPEELLHLHQEVEISHANYVAVALNVPIIMLQSFEVDVAIGKIKIWFEL